jgi:hypothetical protein
VPLYRAGEAGSLVRNLGIRKDVEDIDRRSFTLSRRDTDFEDCRGWSVDGMVASISCEEQLTMYFYGRQLCWILGRD